MHLLVEIMIKKDYCLSCFDIANYVDLGIPNTIYHFRIIPDSINHIEHIIYLLDDYIYQHFVLCLTFWHGNGNLLMIQQSKVTWDLKAITKIYCHPTRTRSIKFTTRFIVSRNHEMKSQSLTTNDDTFVKTLKRKFCVYTLSFGKVFLRVSPKHASNIYS